jgi:iron complex outermembrane receptor protein
MRVTALCITAFLIQIHLNGQVHQKDTSSTLSDSAKTAVLEEVTVRSTKPIVEFLTDRTVVNVAAALTNSGATLLEVLEKSPGVTMDRNGNISLKGRQGVLFLIDGKRTNLTGADLNNLLAGIAAAQVEQIELIDNPGSKYEAAGSAGIINIRTKKNRQDGLNGNLSTSVAQGKYTRSFNNGSFNYLKGKINLFANLSANINRNFSNLYALRTYYAADNITALSILEQPSYFRSRAPSHSIKAGFDYNLSRNTTIGIVASGSGYHRKGTGNNTAIWRHKDGSTDSIISTYTNSREELKSGMINLNFRHAFNSNSELTADIDLLRYHIRTQQFFNNTLVSSAGYDEYVTGQLPSNLDIMTGKLDYTGVVKNQTRVEAGWKSSRIKTNNKALYFVRNGNSEAPDYDKTNNFIYNEDIHAVYGSVERKLTNWTWSAGIRYENTSYVANQLGNLLRKDSSFSRRYDGLFPTFSTSYDVDSNHSFSFTAGRRIDRPPFQSLNPFIFLINKYTYEAGNPFYRPQYTWNAELSHTYRNKLVSSVSYSRTKDYFSQIFTQDSSGIITYTVGNLKFMENVGASFSLQSSVTRWWSLTAFAGVNYKRIRGVVWDERSTRRLQANFNLNNQFVFGNGWSAELSWVQQLHEQELQEITDPSGQVGVGLGKQIFNNKGSIKLAYRDIFYTMWMKGFTVFEQATEYFKITRDTRAVSLAITYRFGAASKTSAQRKTGGAEEEMNRATK